MIKKQPRAIAKKGLFKFVDARSNQGFKDSDLPPTGNHSL
ncbi:hypothetical protein C5S39_13485 [Candidatus Methanophagaceae archaeon]|jgi:hypothetical protein|nr:hypothetical protein C5S39_13485 [Methanophagales archaeon]